MTAQSPQDGPADESWRDRAAELFAELEAGWGTERASESVQPPAAPLPLCGALLLSGDICLLPTSSGQRCPHRRPGPAPQPLGDLVAQLRRDVAEARQVACTLAAAVRYLRGDRGVDAVLQGQQPGWVEPGEPRWPPGHYDPHDR